MNALRVPPTKEPPPPSVLICTPRIFFPQTYDQTSPQTLPTLFSIHGGGFCIGSSVDDDEWNRHFADSQGALVIALNYSKAPRSPFPTGLRDLEALVLAALADESLPIDRLPPAPASGGRAARTALLGFSAGGNLALALAQLPSIRSHPLAPPAAALSVYGALDLSVSVASKLPTRPFKPSLGPPRGSAADALRSLAPTFDWSYIPYGHDLRDPLLSPEFAPRAALPPYVCLVAAELDMLAHESWRLACRLAGEGTGDPGRRGRPDARSGDAAWRVCGREEGEGATAAGAGSEWGRLEGTGDERFAFEERWEGGGVKWLLVPDVVHGFDNSNFRGLMGGGEKTVRDAEMKTEAYVAEIGRWLREVVWAL